MLLLAANLTDTIQQVPTHTWWIVAAVILGLLLLVVIIRSAEQIGRFLLVIVLLLALFLLGERWVYERKEPAWATPAVDWLAGFLPTKGPPAPPHSSRPAK
jgi:membrane protein implicated in regulation of membrane protease activity